MWRKRIAGIWNYATDGYKAGFTLFIGNGNWYTKDDYIDFIYSFEYTLNDSGNIIEGTSINSKTRFVIANEVKHHDYDSIQPYRSSRVSESRVFVRILGRLPRRGVYPELTEGLLAMGIILKKCCFFNYF